MNDAVDFVAVMGRMLARIQLVVPNWNDDEFEKVLKNTSIHHRSRVIELDD